MFPRVTTTSQEPGFTDTALLSLKSVFSKKLVLVHSSINIPTDTGVLFLVYFIGKVNPLFMFVGSRKSCDPQNLVYSH